MTRAADPWLPYGAPTRKDKIRLFCVPHAGAGASAYFGWIARMRSGITLCPLQLPGRESRYREQPFTSMERLTDAMMEYLRPYLDVPFALFGHSTGALVCYEFARRLEPEGLRPVHVFVSGRRAPHLPGRGLPIHLLPDGLLLEELRRLQGVPADALANAEWSHAALPIIRADSALNDTYVWQNGHRLNSDISAIGGANDPYVHVDEIHGWQAHTNRKFWLRLLPGDHFFLRSSRDAVLEIIERALAPAAK